MRRAEGERRAQERDEGLRPVFPAGSIRIWLNPAQRTRHWQEETA
jgi:hypothetical protein